jgi:hypothetical protein
MGRDMGRNHVAGNWNGRGDWRGRGDHGHFRHGRHFRGGFFAFGGYPYYDDYYDDYADNYCYYGNRSDWRWRRYCGPYAYDYGQ